MNILESLRTPPSKDEKSSDNPDAKDLMTAGLLLKFKAENPKINIRLGTLKIDGHPVEVIGFLDFGNNQSSDSGEREIFDDGTAAAAELE